MGHTDGARQVAPGVFWLSLPGRTQTNVYFVRTDTGWVLVDAGWARDASRVRDAAASLFGPRARPEAVVLTHCHPDHSGAAPELVRGWDRPVFMHPAELPVATGDVEAMRAVAGPLDRWVVLPALRALPSRRRERLVARGSLGEHALALEPGSPVPGMPGWDCVATPGHTPGHVCYFRRADRTLLSGDALVTLRVDTAAGLLLGRPGLSGPPWYTSWNRDAARRSVARLARLRPSVVAGGHGTPLCGPGTAAAVTAFASLGLAGAGAETPPTFEVEVTVARPAEAVFALLADIQVHEPLPRNASVRMVKDPPGPTAVGTRWHEEVRLLPGLWLRIESVVTDLAPPSTLVLDFAARWFTGRLTYEVEPTGAGSVLHHRELVRMRRPLRRLTGRVEKRLRARVSQRLVDIKGVLETTA